MSDRKIYIVGKDTLPEKIVLGAGEQCALSIVVLPGVSADIALEVDCTAPGAHVDLSGLYLCLGSEKVTLKVDVRHLADECESHQLFKGIVGGKAFASFDGLVYVKEGTARTKAIQENHSILLGREAVVETRPQLEIYADDVECSHGATTGFLNEDELFYMRSRGIEENVAKRLQMISFLAPVFKDLPEELVSNIEALI